MNQSDETYALSDSEVIGLWRLAEIVTQVSDSELIANFANVCLAFLTPKSSKTIQGNDWLPIFDAYP